MALILPQGALGLEAVEVRQPAPLQIRGLESTSVSLFVMAVRRQVWSLDSTIVMNVDATAELRDFSKALSMCLSR